MSFDPDRLLNFRRRASNLQHDAPFSTMKALLVCLLDLVRSESLETSKVIETDDERTARRIAINETKTTLLELLEDPDVMLANWREEQQRQESMNQ